MRFEARHWSLTAPKC